MRVLGQQAVVPQFLAVAACAADGSTVVLLPNGRAEHYDLKGVVTQIYWNCHEAGTLDLMLTGVTESLAATKDGRLVGRGHGGTLAPLTRDGS